MKHLFWVIALVSLTLVSCDKCKDVTCENGGTCSEGICSCLEGFSGESCSVEDLCITNEVECLNGGECDDGECDCPEWYTGEDCATKVVSEKAGLYAGSYSCGTAYPYLFKFIDDRNLAYEMTLSDESVYDLERTFVIEFTSTKNFVIPEQVVQTYGNDVLKADGEGTFSSTGLTMEINYNNVTQATFTSSSCTFFEF